MPGKESDLPNRKQRKAIGKSNVRGRMAGILPLSEPPYVPSAEPVASENPTYPKFDDTTITYGSMRDIES